ncbi:MAG: heavy-metal-associated domain-containing protein, partial [Proteobacteria bacterium]|nr:heavy-metal-associated domain-containing protein [Pseudomonadota bacterium]
MQFTVNGKNNQHRSNPNMTPSIEKQRVAIRGMHCASCSSRIEKVLGNTEGIRAVAVNLAAESMEVEWETERLSLADIGGIVKG